MYYDNEPGFCSGKEGCKKKKGSWSDTESYDNGTIGARVYVLLVSICVLLLILIGMIIIGIYVALGEFRLSMNPGGDVAGDDMFEVDDDLAMSIVEGKVRITNRIFSEQLKDRNSEEYKKLASEIKQSMDAIFLHNVQHYDRTTIVDFEEGSVIARCQVHFSQPRLDATHKVGMAIIEALERYHGYLPGGMLQVDIRSLCFTGLLDDFIDPAPVIEPTVVELPTKAPGLLDDFIDPAPVIEPAVVELPTKAPAVGNWGAWSEWSKCEPCEMRVRYRKCLDASTPCPGDEKEEYPCECDFEEKLAAHNETIIMECNGDCAIGRVCIFLFKTPYARCLVPRDINDSTGCGGWCPGYHQVCKNLGNATFQCVLVPPCEDGHWQCSNGLCVKITDICNGHDDCLDKSDELNCECGIGFFRCGHNTKCLSDDHKCDGQVDCWDANDELNCTKRCPQAQFTCNNGMCIDMSLFCDHFPDCSDGTDEPDGCNDPCLTMQKECRNGRCIHEGYWCNGVDDCKDGTDEKNCAPGSPIHRPF